MSPRPAASRPPHRSPPLLLGVLVGGAAGTGVRSAVGRVLPHDAGTWPWGTLLANLVGALLLGALLEALVRAGPDVGRRRAVRVVLGSGVLGSLTTTSALALETVEMTVAGAPVTAVAYAVTTLLGGLAAAGLGVALAASRAQRRPGSGPRPGGPA